MKYETKMALREGVISAGGLLTNWTIAVAIGTAHRAHILATPNKIKRGLMCVGALTGGSLASATMAQMVMNMLDEVIPEPMYPYEETDYYPPDKEL